jgi:hypothetical protein
LYQNTLGPLRVKHLNMNLLVFLHNKECNFKMKRNNSKIRRNSSMALQDMYRDKALQISMVRKNCNL